MTPAVARGWSRWIAGMGSMGAALGFFAAMAFGQDSALVAQGKQIFNDQGCYGCHTMGKSDTPRSWRGRSGGDGADAGDRAQPGHARILDGEMLDRGVGIQELLVEGAEECEQRRHH